MATGYSSLTEDVPAKYNKVRIGLNIARDKTNEEEFAGYAVT
jgi:hypothetical protein